MPHVAILRELGMTPQEWGNLPSEDVSSVRRDLKEKAAQAILSRRSDDAKQGVIARVIALESQLAHTQRQTEELLTRVSDLTIGVSDLLARVTALELARASEPQKGG